jgi:hypothetical protein
MVQFYAFVRDVVTYDNRPAVGFSEPHGNDFPTAILCLDALDGEGDDQSDNRIDQRDLNKALFFQCCLSSHISRNCTGCSGNINSVCLRVSYLVLTFDRAEFWFYGAPRTSPAQIPVSQRHPPDSKSFNIGQSGRSSP